MHGDPRPDPTGPDSRPDADPNDGASPLPATPGEERRAAEPLDDSESVAGEEDPGAALDGTSDGPGSDSSKP
jgi:hypothetical protein